MSIKIVLGAAAAIAVGAGALALRLDRGGGDPPASASAPSPAVASAPRARPHVEAPRLATLAVPAPSGTTAPSGGPAPGAAPTPPASGPRELSTAEARETHQRLFDDGEHATPWSRAAVQRAREKLPGALPPGSEVVGVECRGKLCRLESRHRDAESFDQYVEAVFLQARSQLWNGGFYAYLDDPPDGGRERRAVAFLAADGEDLPPP